MKRNIYIRISELAQQAGVPASTIRFYVREGLLPPPVKVAKTRAYYSDEHLERLLYVRKLASKENKSLREIKEIVEEKFKDQDAAAVVPERLNTDRRELIINSAIKLFRQKGLSDTSIGDIVTLSGIGKDTFYHNFDSKEHLFIECADRIFYDMYDDIYQEIRGEKDIIKRLAKRREAFLAHYPQWVDMMNLIRGNSASKNPVFVEKLHQVMKQITEPIIRDIEIGKKQGVFRKDIDSFLAGYMLMATAEYFAYLGSNNICSVDDLASFADDSFSRILLTP